MATIKNTIQNSEEYLGIDNKTKEELKAIMTEEEYETFIKEYEDKLYNSQTENVTLNVILKDAYAGNKTSTNITIEENTYTTSPSTGVAYSSKENYASSSAKSLDTYGIFNTPHQFTPETDPRYSSSGKSADWRGRAYTEHILINSPVVVFKMGKPNYMEGDYNSDSVSRISELLSKTDSAYDDIEILYGKKGSANETYYYTFKDDFSAYCKYVNAMVRFTATKMGLSEYKNFDLNETKFRSKNFLQDFVKGALNLSNFLAFYVEGGGTSYSESGSNSTGDSQLASGIKNLGQTKRELDFLFGAESGASKTAGSDTYGSYAESLRSSFTGIDGIDNVLNKLSGTFTSISSGANVLFPEIWQDSSYRSSYEVEIRLSSPYGDKESIFQNIYIPFMCLLAMALPRQSGKQGYTGPFLIQCFSKGNFSCNLGMVESINVKKGGPSGKDWSVDNLPTEITVNLSIKDLYPTMMATSMRSHLVFANNTGLCEYLKMMAGVELINFNPQSNIEEAINALLGTIGDIPMNVYNRAQSIIGGPAKFAITKIFGGMN